jgi:hypothetical protein
MSAPGEIISGNENAGVHEGRTVEHVDLKVANYWLGAV